MPAPLDKQIVATTCRQLVAEGYTVLQPGRVYLSGSTWVFCDWGIDGNNLNHRSITALFESAISACLGRDPEYTRWVTLHLH